MEFYCAKESTEKKNRNGKLGASNIYIEKEQTQAVERSHTHTYTHKITWTLTTFVVSIPGKFKMNYQTIDEKMRTSFDDVQSLLRSNYSTTNALNNRLNTQNTIKFDVENRKN